MRDGAQTHGVDFTEDEKRTVAAMLDELRVDYIEGGWPGANRTDAAFFSNPPALKHARLVAFGMTCRPGRSADNDPSLVDVLNADVPVACLVAKTWDFHVKTALRAELPDNLRAVTDSIAAGRARGKEMILDAEHFFDGWRANPDYAFQCLEHALEAGARWVVLCDTNGGALPHYVYEAVDAVAQRFGGDVVGIHAHNDAEAAVANTLAAVRAGARHVQGTLNGLGERCGNANLVSLIPTFALKPDFADAFRISPQAENIRSLTRVSRKLDAALNRIPHKHAAYVGDAAFVHKGGLHVSAVVRDPATYEHVPPDVVGNRRRIPMSEQAGRASLAERLRDSNVPLDDDEKLTSLLAASKERENQGYAYDDADASFALFARRNLGLFTPAFAEPTFRVIIEKRANALGKIVTISEAVVRMLAQERRLVAVGDGVGPVHALGEALKGCLRQTPECAKWCDDFVLADYRVRILNSSGLRAVTRVLIDAKTLRDERAFTTVGVSDNILDASFEALVDAMHFLSLTQI